MPPESRHATRPLVPVGGISYALYLVHWPVLVLWLATADRTRAGFVDGAGVVAVSLVVAWLLSRLVERPLRALPWPQVAPLRSTALVLGVAGIVVGAAAAGVVRMDAGAARGSDLSSGTVVAGMRTGASGKLLASPRDRLVERGCGAASPAGAAVTGARSGGFGAASANRFTGCSSSASSTPALA